MSNIVYFNGKFVPEKDAVVSVKTHALQYGTGCFEGIRAYYSEDDDCLYAFRLEDHYKRLMLSGLILCMTTEHSIEDLCKITAELLQKNYTKEDIYVRPFFYKSDTVIGGFLLPKLTSSLSIYTVPLGRYLNTEKGIRCMVTSWQRVSDNSIPPRAKITGAYVNTALAKSDALLAGYDEAIFLDKNGHVLEGSAENIFVIRDGQVITPSASSDILIGITRATIMELLQKELNITAVEREIDKTELYQADEVFVVGTGAEVTPVVEIDGRKLGDGKPGPITSKLKQLYFDIVHGKNKTYSSWLTKVTEK